MMCGAVVAVDGAERLGQPEVRVRADDQMASAAEKPGRAPRTSAAQPRAVHTQTLPTM